MVFGLVRRKQYEELQRQNEEFKAYMKVLTGEVEMLRKEVAVLRKETNASKKVIWQLQEETNHLSIQKGELADSVEILTKERELFQKTIRTLYQAMARAR